MGCNPKLGRGYVFGGSGKILKETQNIISLFSILNNYKNNNTLVWPRNLPANNFGAHDNFNNNFNL